MYNRNKAAVSNVIAKRRFLSLLETLETKVFMGFLTYQSIFNEWGSRYGQVALMLAFVSALKH